MSSTKRQNLAADMVEAATALMDAIYRWRELRARYTGPGITFDDADFRDVEGLDHLAAADIVGAISSTATIDAFVTDNWHHTNLEKLRR